METRARKFKAQNLNSMFLESAAKTDTKSESREGASPAPVSKKSASPKLSTHSGYTLEAINRSQEPEKTEQTKWIERPSKSMSPAAGGPSEAAAAESGAPGSPPSVWKTPGHEPQPASRHSTFEMNEEELAKKGITLAQRFTDDVDDWDDDDAQAFYEDEQPGPKSPAPKSPVDSKPAWGGSASKPAVRHLELQRPTPTQKPFARNLPSLQSVQGSSTVSGSSSTLDKLSRFRGTINDSGPRGGRRDSFDRFGRTSRYDSYSGPSHYSDHGSRYSRSSVDSDNWRPATHAPARTPAPAPPTSPPAAPAAPAAAIMDPEALHKEQDEAMKHDLDKVKERIARENAENEARLARARARAEELARKQRLNSETNKQHQNELDAEKRRKKELERPRERQRKLKDSLSENWTEQKKARLAQEQAAKEAGTSRLRNPDNTLRKGKLIDVGDKYLLPTPIGPCNQEPEPASCGQSGVAVVNLPELKNLSVDDSQPGEFGEMEPLPDPSMPTSFTSTETSWDSHNHRPVFRDPRLEGSEVVRLPDLPNRPRSSRKVSRRASELQVS